MGYSSQLLAGQRLLEQRRAAQNSTKSAQTTDVSGWMDGLRVGLVGGEENENSLESADFGGESPDFVSKTSQPVQRRPHETAIYSSLLARILHEGAAARGRVWLMLREYFVTPLDRPGWGSADEVREVLESRFGFSWRRGRQILQDGEGVFWTRDKQDRYWLTGAAALADSLGLERLQGDRVVLPLKDITGKLKRAKAAMWAGFHAGRDINPISRRKQREIMGVSERTQREYSAENPDLITVQVNYSIEAVDRGGTEREEHYYKYGGAGFDLLDADGKQGRRGRAYLARQLPSTHHASYKHAARGRKRKDNRRLSGHVTTGRMGTDSKAFERVFYPDDAGAAVKKKRRSGQFVYFKTMTARNGAGIWHTI